MGIRKVAVLVTPLSRYSKYSSSNNNVRNGLVVSEEASKTPLVLCHELGGPRVLGVVPRVRVCMGGGGGGGGSEKSRRVGLMDSPSRPRARG